VRTATKYRWDDMAKERVNSRIERRLVVSERMMLAHVYLERGAIVPIHLHENEQLTYVLEGVLRLWVGAEGSSDIRNYDVRGVEEPRLPEPADRT